MDYEIDRPFNEFLKELAGSGPISVRTLFRLSDLLPEELEQFCATWPGMDPERRRIVARHLADITEENFEVDFSSVFAFCLGDASVQVRLASLDGLWDTDKVLLIGPIIDLMQTDPETEVRRLAAATLGHFLLMAEWNQIPRRSVTRATEALLEQLESLEVDIIVRRAALESLGASSHERVPSLISDAYDSGDLDLQLSAVYAMGQSADTRWLPVLRDEMTSSIDEMRVEAAKASGNIGHGDAVPELGELVWDHDLEVRLAAVHALGQIGSDVAQQILEVLAVDEDSEELHAAVQEALEELSWLGGQIDLSSFDWDNNLDE